MFGFAGLPDGAAAALLVAAFVGGVVRGFTGFGFAMVFVPAASMAVGPATAVALIWLMDAPYAFPLAARSFGRAVWREIAPLTAGAVLAVPIGAWLLLRLDPALVRWIVAISIAAALATLISGWRYVATPRMPLSFGVGGLSGLYSGLAQIGGAPLAIFWLGSPNDARRTRDNLLTFFALTTITSGIVFVWSGLLRLEHVWLAIPPTIAYGLGLLVGVRCFGLASEQTFRRIAYLVIAGSVLLALPVFDRWFR